MNKLVVIAMALAVAGCIESPGPVVEEAATSNDYETICLDGVRYWYKRDGYRESLAPRIDPETLQPVRC